MEIIIKSPKYGVQKVLIDKEDFNKLAGFNLSLSCSSKKFLYVRLSPSKRYLHRMIMDAPKGMVVDHINRNTLDNRKKNLRVCTIQENLQNQKRENNKTGYTGVAVFPKGRFSAQITVNYKKIHLGLFNNVEDAYKVRKAAEEIYFA